MAIHNDIRRIAATGPEGELVTLLEFTKSDSFEFEGIKRQRGTLGVTYFLDGTFEPLRPVSKGVFQLTAGVRRFTASS
ncbi:MAG TPA: hypothetical protein VNC50_00475 [Planctomycetia bacterium]|nr:hypothetical protein [Planctomycetia bacterium]